MASCLLHVLAPRDRNLRWTCGSDPVSHGCLFFLRVESGRILRSPSKSVPVDEQHPSPSRIFPSTACRFGSINHAHLKSVKHYTECSYFTSRALTSSPRLLRMGAGRHPGRVRAEVKKASAKNFQLVVDGARASTDGGAGVQVIRKGIGLR